MLVDYLKFRNLLSCCSSDLERYQFYSFCLRVDVHFKQSDVWLFYANVQYYVCFQGHHVARCFSTKKGSQPSVLFFDVQVNLQPPFRCLVYSLRLATIVFWIWSRTSILQCSCDVTCCASLTLSLFFYLDLHLHVKGFFLSRMSCRSGPVPDTLLWHNYVCNFTFFL